MKVSASQAPIVRDELAGRVRLKFVERGWFSSRTFLISGPPDAVEAAHTSIFNKLHAQMEDEMQRRSGNSRGR